MNASRSSCERDIDPIVHQHPHSAAGGSRQDVAHQPDENRIIQTPLSDLQDVHAGLRHGCGPLHELVACCVVTAVEQAPIGDGRNHRPPEGGAHARRQTPAFGSCGAGV